ncbi:MAG: hypothetical protein CMJ18_03025 [Phycisphaeraceae bacterium]|nr:hypothetical protein [Phycisphaeraceae bacterium]
MNRSLPRRRVHIAKSLPRAVLVLIALAVAALAPNRAGAASFDADATINLSITGFAHAGNGAGVSISAADISPDTTQSMFGNATATPVVSTTLHSANLNILPALVAEMSAMADGTAGLPPNSLANAGAPSGVELDIFNASASLLTITFEVDYFIRAASSATEPQSIAGADTDLVVSVIPDFGPVLEPVNVFVTTFDIDGLFPSTPVVLQAVESIEVQVPAGEGVFFEVMTEARGDAAVPEPAVLTMLCPLLGLLRRATRPSPR